MDKATNMLYLIFKKKGNIEEDEFSNRAGVWNMIL